MSLKLSIIVPFYNVEKFLRFCLDSLLEQDIPHSDYEIICVNDCSPDNSRLIVKDYQKKYPNIILIDHNENKKLGTARNTGLYHAKGDYIWFVDSDDMINKNCLNHILCTCIENGLDVLMINYSRCAENGLLYLEDKVFVDTKVSSGIQFVNNVFGDSFVYHFGYVPRMIFSAKYLHDISAKFPEGVFWEDTVFMPRTIILANKVASIAESYYIYRINTTSITQVTQREHRADLLFQFAFNTGSDLITFSKEIEDVYPDMSKVIFNRSKWYLNSFGYRILRADTKQRRLFFELVSKNKSFINPLRSYMTTFNNLLCVNFHIGFILTTLISPIYKLRNKYKSK